MSYLEFSCTRKPLTVKQVISKYMAAKVVRELEHMHSLESMRETGFFSRKRMLRIRSKTNSYCNAMQFCPARKPSVNRGKKSLRKKRFKSDTLIQKYATYTLR